MKISKVTFFTLLLVSLISPIFARNMLYCSVYAQLEQHNKEIKKDYINCLYEKLKGVPPQGDAKECLPVSSQLVEKFKKLCMEG